MKRITSYVIAAAMLAGLLGAGTAAEAAKLRIGAHRALMGSFEIVAHKAGFWKKQGLEYTISNYKQGKLMRNAIIQGNLDTGTTGFSPFATAISKGARVTAIGVTANICDTQHIVVPVNSKAKSLKDLKGVTFANKKGTSTDFSFQQYVVPAHGLKSSDFPLLSVRTTERVAAIVSGNAKAAMLGDPMLEISIQAGQVRSLENLCKYDKTRMMHVGNPATLKKHPELYEKYFRGWLMAHKLLKDNPDEYAKIYHKDLVDIGTKVKLDIIKVIVRRLRSEVFITGEVKTYLNDMARRQKKMGWIKKTADFTKTKFIDDSILRKVAKEMNYTN
ncbi:MAG: ABC transporter substrate-binding protein [Nitrospinaceae bacterium]|jgi:ABC-type nitrate/sulfonate/bicarbonate transport system substrate-binding protein|nr:ABC transporter substrate-binding protein [Nitrospinaceae bacterium]MBT3433400.1 ABC transporter substrate-binding protein [Nitrospinaceae bacterium]MBT3823303.1 ABC transporter substrate-binding protein [Nitrospinaceae bacterium]MBT4095232.1 ABC transporter substrate-binding protein [Nitrospinaceae bacterium]MBT4429379.1 ABC transporter substrate-binding protein [Nitrospinaceae bacterium]